MGVILHSSGTRVANALEEHRLDLYCVKSSDVYYPLVLFEYL